MTARDSRPDVVPSDEVVAGALRLARLWRRLAEHRTWRPIAEGANRTSKNLARLAEVFAGFGYRKEAIIAMADAISLDKDDFGLLMTYAERDSIRGVSMCSGVIRSRQRCLNFRVSLS